jgi:hypothetical protein
LAEYDIRQVDCSTVIDLNAARFKALRDNCTTTVELFFKDTDMDTSWYVSRVDSAKDVIVVNIQVAQTQPQEEA